MIVVQHRSNEKDLDVIDFNISKKDFFIKNK